MYGYSIRWNKFRKAGKITSTIDIIKKKQAALEKSEEEIVDITTDDSSLEEIVNEGMPLKFIVTNSSLF